MIKHYGINIRWDEQRQWYIAWVPEIPELWLMSYSRSKAAKGIYEKLRIHINKCKAEDKNYPDAALYDIDSHLPGLKEQLAEKEAAHQREMAEFMNKQLEAEVNAEELGY